MLESRLKSRVDCVEPEPVSDNTIDTILGIFVASDILTRSPTLTSKISIEQYSGANIHIHDRYLYSP
jgi:hypothetical protein